MASHYPRCSSLSPGTISRDAALYLHSGCINIAPSNPTAPMRCPWFVIIYLLLHRDVDEKKNVDVSLGASDSLNLLSKLASLCEEALWDLHVCTRTSTRLVDCSLICCSKLKRLELSGGWFVCLVRMGSVRGPLPACTSRELCFPATLGMAGFW